MTEAFGGRALEGDFKDDKPSDRALHEKCFACHVPAKDSDYTYLSVNGGVPDLVAHALIGYGMLPVLSLQRLPPGIMQHPFAAAYPRFTFRVTALCTAPVMMVSNAGAALLPHAPSTTPRHGAT